ncbi:molybdopterin converting factor subunit 1 [Hahella sp. CCB-MM4]|uniref:molybdopterin converting factor subunit 1 n=1 Tax=Hahella sp. (strain CCB-MM4) TaxID=1926491 RepID=UPI000B9AC564|nr:molybdopterin converting factor subunit 1 [Hahella sp. CCB-MM4]OZG71975.1 molybdopterin converting factor subunit 1 [Hahella sp. CCB-MM4]
MVKILFFARLREAMGCAEMEIAWNGDGSVNDVKDLICQQLPQAKAVFEQGKVLCAVNQDMVKAEHAVLDGDEIAFFPPVTGG